MSQARENRWPAAGESGPKAEQHERIPAPQWMQELLLNKSLIPYYDFGTDQEQTLPAGVCAHQLIEKQREVLITIIGSILECSRTLDRQTAARAGNILRINRIEDLKDVSVTIDDVVALQTTDAPWQQQAPIIAQQLLSQWYQRCNAQQGDITAYIDFLTNLHTHLEGSLAKLRKTLPKPIRTDATRIEQPEWETRKKFFDGLLPGTEINIAGDPPLYMIYSGVDDPQHPTTIVGTYWPEETVSLKEGGWVTSKIPDHVRDPGKFISTAFQTPAPEDFSTIQREQWSSHWFDTTVNNIRIRLVRTIDGYAMLITDATVPAKNQKETKDFLKLFPQAYESKKILEDFEFLVDMAHQGSDIQGMREALEDCITYAAEETRIQKLN
ncbi:hypothetical protein HZA86_01325 [Candidatus Uhrbacteria bacterium]|nr:hypothetical protein [Candidatus Uhrbacteria bacterium]